MKKSGVLLFLSISFTLHAYMQFPTFLVRITNLSEQPYLLYCYNHGREQIVDNEKNPPTIEPGSIMIDLPCCLFEEYGALGKVDEETEEQVIEKMPETYLEYKNSEAKTTKMPKRIDFLNLNTHESCPADPFRFTRIDAIEAKEEETNQNEKFSTFTCVNDKAGHNAHVEFIINPDGSFAIKPFKQNQQPVPDQTTLTIFSAKLLTIAE